MDYLFFDIECANCFHGSGKICEFGYVITNENFDIKEKEIFLVNPNSVFDRFVAKKMLANPIVTYKAAAPYPEIFSKIKRLFDCKNMLIIGHTVDADAGYLNDESRRYNLPFFNYTFYDAKELYMAYANKTQSVGLEKTGEELGVAGPEHAHRSVDDAQATMQTVKAMCNSLDTTLEELIELCPNCLGKTENGVIWTQAREQAFSNAVEANRMTKSASKKYIEFRNTIKINRQAKSPVAGKTICFSRNYEDYHLKEMMLLTKTLAELGAKCDSIASKCDIFVKNEMSEESNKKPCMRLAAATKEIESGRNIQICTLEELLDMIDLTIDDLEKAPIPCEDDFINMRN